ncbi:MAG: lipoprotein-releasing system ATP-binding protein LolD, partial [Deltaproteobacteria bacterium]|nr:lipoprotein-releasing system ATP-binding protein LolD [Deltaproteobacteria bacterium]
TLLDRLHASHNLTMVSVTHNDLLAARMDRTLRMEDGCLKSEERK